MKYFFYLILLLILISGCPTKPYRVRDSYKYIQKSGRERNHWILVWADEFEETSLDTTKWTLMLPEGSEWTSNLSNKSQCYAIFNGKLYLKIIANPDTISDSRKYLTGGIRSKDKFAFQYGKIEVRAKLEQAKGAWPAIWLRSVKSEDLKSDINDEIVLMEHHNYDDYIYQLIHLKENQPDNKKYANTIRSTVKTDVYDFNTFGLEWYPDSLVFTVNNERKSAYSRENAQKQWTFNQPYYIVLNQQIGSWWIGEANKNDLPINMIIEYVRVYQ